MEKIKPIDLMEKCPICGENPVFGYLCTEKDGVIKFNVHCPGCGCNVAKIYIAKVNFCYTGNLSVSSEVQFAVDDWNNYVNSIKDQFKKENKDSRTSMSFSNEVYEYIKGMARFKGITMSEFANDILQKSMEKDEAYKFILEAREKLNVDRK